MVAAAALLTAGPELARLGALPAPQRLHHADVNVIMAVAFGLLSDRVFASQGEGDPATLAALADRLALAEAAMREELQRIHNQSSSPQHRRQLVTLAPTPPAPRQTMPLAATEQSS